MTFVIRVVDNISKWDLGSRFDPDDFVDADPIGHLKTSNNELSVFVVDNIINIEHIVIAIATARAGLDKFHCVIAEKTEIMEKGIAMKSSPETGITPVDKANKQHWNLCELKARDLEALAKIFLVNVNKKKNYFRTFNKQMVKSLVKSAINDNTFIMKDKINQKLINQLEKD